MLRVWDWLAFEAWTRINQTLVKHKTVKLQLLVKEHEEIVDALVKGDGKAAGNLLRQHFETALMSQTDRLP